MTQPKTITLTIKTETETRADLAVLKALKSDYPQLSRSKLKQWFAENRIQKNLCALSPSDLLPPGTHEVQILRFEEGATTPPLASAAQECFLPVLYEDENLLVLNKKSGIPSVPHSPDDDRTAVGAALAHFSKLREIGRGGLEPGILHRLDTGTSGVIIFSKTEKEFQRLQTLWKTSAVKKIYRAVVRASDPEAAQKLSCPLTITTPLAHDAKSAKKMLALTPELVDRHSLYRGKPLPAMTRVTRCVTNETRREKILDLEIEIETGVMHQIRCHLASVGWPILGDPVYRGIPSSRLWLHAWKVKLLLESGTELLLETSLPGNWPGHS